MKSAMSFDKVLEYIEENLYEDICLDQLASPSGYSK